MDVPAVSETSKIQIQNGGNSNFWATDPLLYLWLLRGLGLLSLMADLFMTFNIYYRRNRVFPKYKYYMANVQVRIEFFISFTRNLEKKKPIY